MIMITTMIYDQDKKAKEYNNNNYYYYNALLLFIHSFIHLKIYIL